MIWILVTLVMLGVAAFVTGLAAGVVDIIFEPVDPWDDYKHKLEEDNIACEKLDKYLADNEKRIAKFRKAEGLEDRRKAAREKLQSYYAKQSDIADSSAILVREPVVH